MAVIAHLHSMRQAELESALKLAEIKTPLKSPISLLELGAGTGHQAKILSDLGFLVTAIDLPSSAYAKQRVFPITEYDGVKLPLADNSIQVVFSSNVLEHVKNIEQMLDEIRRVLVPGGIAIHVLPTSIGRFWSLLSHYGWLSRRILNQLFPAKQLSNQNSDISKPRIPRTKHDILVTLFPHRHGERGNSITEIYYYSKHWWTKVFEKHGFQITKTKGNGIFYTMANFLDEGLELHSRRKLSGFLGSVCRIYIMIS